MGDATFEKLHEVMKSNPAGILVLRDELTGWLAQLDKSGRETERAFSLEAWNGDAAFTIDRVGRGLVHVNHVCMSLFGGIQPGRLHGYLADALKDGPGDDGLIQRFQVLVWPDLPADFELVDRQPDHGAVALAQLVYSRLVELPCDAPATFTFAADAQELFGDWYSELQRNIRGESLAPALASHQSKYAKLMPALALIFELADQAAEGRWSSDQAGLDHTRQSAAFCEYLKSHAGRLYFSVASREMQSAAELGKHIRRAELGENGAFSLRDVYRPQWAGLNTSELANSAIRVLIDCDWVRDRTPELDRHAGRPSTRFVINPRLRR